jgi:hypothetical protein
VEHFKVEQSNPSEQMRQVTWWHLEERTLAPDTQTPVLFGRDLDGDRLPDAWFYRDEYGILQGEDRPSARLDGWDVAQEILSREIKLSNRWLIAVGLNAVFSKLTFTIDQMNQVEATVLAEELDIRTLEIQSNRIARTDPRNSALPVFRSLITRSYSDLARRLETEEMRDLYASLAGDAALLFLTGGMGKMLVKFEAWALTKMGGSSAAKAAQAAFVRYSEGLTARAARGGTRLAAEALAKAEVQLLARMAPIQAVRTAISGVIARSRFKATAGHILSHTAAVARASASQWKYIALTQSLQVGAELLSRGKEIFDPNPIVMAKKMASNAEFMQNFLYMSNETFWMAGLSTYFQTPGKRILSCALFSLMDSAVMNYAIKGSVDPERQAFDTGWEVVAGNLQTQIDLASLRTVEASVQRTGNPRLRLLGYLVVIADQGAGYYGYSRASMALEESKEETVVPATVETHVVPVMGPM